MRQQANRIARVSALLFAIASVLLLASAPGPTAGAAASAPSPQAQQLISSPQIKGVPIEAKAIGSGPLSFRSAVPYAESLNTPQGQGYLGEVEPNGTFGTASPIVGTNAVVRGNLFPNGDIDFYSFPAAAGDRVYVATMTAWSAGSSTDSQITLLATNGVTVIEFDDDNGSILGLSSSVAGATIPSPGTYFLRINDFTAGTTSERPYELHFRLQSGAPTPETEPNDTPATANPLPASGWVSGTRNPAAATEQDWYSLTLAPGDTVYLSLDVDPERDATVWNGRLGIALFGDAGNQILVVDDAGASEAPNPTIPSEALFMTVKTGGTFFAFVDSASAAVGGPTATYNLSVSVHPAADEGVNCTTYTSTDVPKTIGPGTGLVSSVLTVPGNPRIADLDVNLVLNHALMADIDAQLRSPSSNDNGIFTDIGAAAVGGQTMMDTIFDDEAGMTPLFTVMRTPVWKPELLYRLNWFDGENAGGTWTLDLRDDTAGANGGTLTAWSLRICEPPPPPACPPGFAPQTVFTTDFEAGAAGFTHAGVADEWELGLPATAGTVTPNPVAAFLNCNSGVNCWKTDLDNTYNVSSSQDLLSPNINLAGLMPPVVVTWAQRYQMESATFDHYFLDYQQAGGATPVRLFEWLDATMTNTAGNPTVNIPASAGWSVFSRRADSLAGLNTELRFHLDSDTTINFAGVAVDDVSVTACRPLSADLAITKTDGVASATPGGSTTYTITASNAGPDPVVGASVADTFPASLTCTWTCVGAGGGTCTAAGAGNIADTVNLPAGGSVTYTASCAIASSATGTLVNTATVSSAVTDPDPANNSATDTDTLTPSADISVTKTDGVASAVPGQSVTYTIVASNAGPSDAPSVSVADTFPAVLSCTWTCVGAGGGTCTAGPVAGNIADTANLPAGGSATYTAVCTIASSATGSLSNTATVSSATPDPDPADNSATDTDTLTPQADLGITKTDGLTTATAGQPTTYTIVVTNPGPSDAPGSSVSDTFPAALTGVTWTCVGAGGGTCTAAGAGNIADTANLPSGGMVTYTVNATIDAAFTGTLSNTATVATAAGVTDPNPADNSATDTTTVGAPAGADVSGTKTAAGDFSEGGTIFYMVVLTNNGAGAQGDNPGNEFTDTLPASLTLVGATASSGTPGTAGNTVTWNGSIPAGGTVTITIEATINAGTSGSTVSNQGTISYDSDGNGTNDATAQTDDPAVVGGSDPTDFVIGGQGAPGVLDIPTLSDLGLALLALALVGMAIALIRRRRTA